MNLVGVYESCWFKLCSAQNAYGDWAAIAIGGQHFLFCDFEVLINCLVPI